MWQLQTHVWLMFLDKPRSPMGLYFYDAAPVSKVLDVHSAQM